MLNNNSKTDIKNCYLLPDSTSLHLASLIPECWGVSVPLLDNYFFMDGSLNVSKGNQNIFTWLQDQTREIKYRFYSKLLPDLATKNNMTAADLKIYIYKCEQQYLTANKVA